MEVLKATTRLEKRFESLSEFNICRSNRLAVVVAVAVVMVQLFESFYKSVQPSTNLAHH